MKVIGKTEALRVRQSLLIAPTAGRKVMVGTFDGGKYKWTGRAADYIGKDVTDIDGVHAVFVERRADASGPYAALLSVYEA